MEPADPMEAIEPSDVRQRPGHLGWMRDWRTILPIVGAAFVLVVWERPLDPLLLIAVSALLIGSVR